MMSIIAPSFLALGVVRILGVSPHFMWVLLPIPYWIIFRWLLIGLLEMLLAGIVVAAIYRPLAPAKA